MDPGDLTCADLTITKTPDGGTYKIGERPIFTITVTAIGAPKNVTLSDTLPTLGSLVWVFTADGNPGNACTLAADGKTLACAFGDLANAATRVVKVQPQVAVTAAECGLLPNVAKVKADNVPEKMDPGDLTCADLTITKTPDGGTYKIGERPIFTITVTAIGAPKNV